MFDFSEEFYIIFSLLRGKVLYLLDNQNGIYDFSKKEDVDRMIAEYNTHIKKPPSVIVIEDTTTDFNSKNKNIVPIGKGNIWKNSETLMYLIRTCKSKNIPILTSTGNDVLLLREITNQLFV